MHPKCVCWDGFPFILIQGNFSVASIWRCILFCKPWFSTYIIRTVLILYFYLKAVSLEKLLGTGRHVEYTFQEQGRGKETSIFLDPTLGSTSSNHVLLMTFHNTSCISVLVKWLLRSLAQFLIWLVVFWFLTFKST